MIRGITFSEQMFYSADFAHFMNTFLCGGVGITKGCACTNDGTKVTIGKGYFVAHGRLMNVESAEVIDATKGFQSGYNRIVYEIDLSKENTILEFRQGAIKVLQTETLVQQDLDADGSVYQFPFCHFQWSGTAITSFIVDAPALVLDDILDQWSDNYDAVNAQFDTWFNGKKSSVESTLDTKITETETWAQQKKQVVNNLIAGLEEGGFEKKSVYSETTLLASNWNATAKTYSFESTYPVASYDIEMWLNSTATDEQAEAFNGAQIESVYGQNVAKARGEVPTIDIPVILKVVAK